MLRCGLRDLGPGSIGRCRFGFGGVGPPRLGFAGTRGVRRDADVHALLAADGGVRRRERLYVLLADVVDEEGAGDLVLPVREPGVVCELYSAVAQVVENLVGVAAGNGIGVRA